MKAAVSVCVEAPALSRPRLADYVELAKPRIAVLVLFTVGAGVLLAGGRGFSFLVLLHTVFGTALVAAGASALNQWLERDSDALMRRTERRPLPSGRLQAAEVFVFGLALGLGGTLYLALALNTMLPAFLAALTFVLYVAVYTPLKRRTPLNTLIGAVPGALPPLIGWCAVRGEISRESAVLFLILFLWQVPHFLAIAWMYRDEYARAGLQMLPVVDRDGQRTSQNMILYCMALVAVSLQPVMFGEAGLLYLGGAVLLGLTFLASTIAFFRHRAHGPARRVLRASLLYLPGLLALLLLDRVLPGLLVSH
jgi:protoheme IX farnesyltransferase